MPELLPLGIILLLVVLNGAFVLAEFVLVAVPRPSIEHRVARGERLARIARAVLRDPRKQDRYFATSQVGITAASLGLGMYGEHVLADWFFAALDGLGASRWAAAHALASALAVTLLTYIHVVVGEVVPKSLGLQYAERAFLWIAPPMLALKNLLFPLVALLNFVATALLKLMGVTRQPSSDRFYTPEELELVVLESEERGMLRADAGRMLRELFEFGDLTAGQVMVPRVRIIGIPLGAETGEIQGLLRKWLHTRYPIFDGDLDHIVGMIHIKDLLRRVEAREPIERSHVRPMPVVPETAPLDTVLATMRRERAQMAIVIDEHGGTAGIVTLEDLFEEVVGEIDEGPVLRPDVYRDAAGRLRVGGTVRLDEVGQQFELDLEHEQVDSVSGLVLMLLDRPPKVGDVVDHGRLRFEVTAVQGRGVRECAVARVEPEPPESDAG